MSNHPNAIVSALALHGGWITGLSLRDLLPADARGEGFDLQLAQLLKARRVLRRIDDEGQRTIYRIAPENTFAPVAAPVPIHAPGPQLAVEDAFHPPAPSLLISQGKPGEHEIPPPKPKARPNAAEDAPMAEEQTDYASRVLDLLKEQGPQRTGEMATRLKISPATVSRTVKELAAAKKIGHEGNTHSPWMLLNGHGGEPVGAVAVDRPSQRARNRESAGRLEKVALGDALKVIQQALATKPAPVADLETKVETLEKLAAFFDKSIAKVLRAVVVDLERFAS